MAAGFDHLELTATVALAALLVTGAVWVARFWFFDRVVFAVVRPGGAPQPAPSVLAER